MVLTRIWTHRRPHRRQTKRARKNSPMQRNLRVTNSLSLMMHWKHENLSVIAICPVVSECWANQMPLSSTVGKLRKIGSKGRCSKLWQRNFVHRRLRLQPNATTALAAVRLTSSWMETRCAGTYSNRFMGFPPTCSEMPFPTQRKTHQRPVQDQDSHNVLIRLGSGIKVFQLLIRSCCLAQLPPDFVFTSHDATLTVQPWFSTTGDIKMSWQRGGQQLITNVGLVFWQVLRFAQPIQIPKSYSKHQQRTLLNWFQPTSIGYSVQPTG
jgi:hypothetical protein